MDIPIRMPAPVDAVQPQRVCGWCWREIAPGTQPATYGICRRCYVELERDGKRREEH
jgi:hypothetical protein